AIKRELGNRHGIIPSLSGMAAVAKDQGDYTAAFAYARECLALARELNTRMDLIYLLRLMVDLAVASGELEMAARMCSALEKAREEMRYPFQPIYREEYEKVQRDLKERLGIEVYEAARSE